jgi:hypothetical protein
MYGLFVFEESFYHKYLSYRLVGLYDTEEESIESSKGYETDSNEVFTLKLLGEIVMFEHHKDGSFYCESWYNNIDEIDEEWEENIEGILDAKYRNKGYNQIYGVPIFIDQE